MNKLSILLTLFCCTLITNCMRLPSEQKQRAAFSEFKEKARNSIKHDSLVNENYNLNISDSISTNVKIFKTRIESKNIFIKSKTEVNLRFYKENNALKFIAIKEESKKYKDTDKFIDYIIDNDTITNHHRYYGVQLGATISISDNYEKQVVLNQSLTDEFYRDFSLKLYELIKKNPVLK